MPTSDDNKKKAAVKYIGETSRSAFERFKEHREDFKGIEAGSHILKHYLESHREIPMDELEMKMKVLKKYKNSFERQIGESIWINHNLKEGTILLNSKNEYNRCSIPRLGLMMTKEDIIDEYRESQKEKEFRREIIKLKEEIRRGTKDEPNKSKKLKLSEVCKEIIRENQFEWYFKKKKDERLRVERELEEEKRNNLKAKMNAEKLKLKEKIEMKAEKKKLRAEEKKKLAEFKKSSWKEIRDKDERDESIVVLEEDTETSVDEKSELKLKVMLEKPKLNVDKRIDREVTTF